MFGSKLKTVYILGAGPAGMLAAHAVHQTRPKAKVVMFSMPEAGANTPKRSELYGCQYLHEYIPGLGLPEKGRLVDYQVIGEYEDYRAKVYGRGWSGNTSVDEYGPEGAHYAWDLRAAYDTLWSRYWLLVLPTLVNSHVLRPLLEDRSAITVSTIPLRTICVDPRHDFLTQDIWAMGSRDITDAQERMPYLAPDMTVQCNGTRDTAWYRAATVFGYSTVEWPGAKKPPLATVAAVRKPLSTDCDCWPGMVRAGRFGKWQKGVLVHTVYNEVQEILA